MIGNYGQHRYKNKHNTCSRKEQCIISIAKINLIYLSGLIIIHILYFLRLQ